MSFWCTFALLVVFVEGATEIICKSLIFQGVRGFLSSIHPFIADLLRCGYCTSVWVSAPGAFYLATQVGTGASIFFWFILFTVIVHRLSNFLHNFNDKHLDKFYSQVRKG